MNLLKRSKNNTKKRTNSKKKVSKNKVVSFVKTPKYLLPLVFIVLFAGVGVWQLVFSKAATVDRGATAYVSNSDGCWLAGRPWSNSSCLKKCRSDTGSYIAATSTRRGYCTKSIATTVGPTSCASLGRIYVSSTGCSRRADGTTTAGARQCRYSNNTYYAVSGTDYCGLQCPTGLIKAVSSCPSIARVAPTVASVNVSDQASVNSFYNALVKSGESVTQGWTGNTSTCSPGTISQAAVVAQANVVNFARQINGLGPVQAVAPSDSVHINAERSALIMEANGALNHNPTSTWKCYSSAGASTAGLSNLALSFPSVTPVQAMKLYLTDPGSGNGAVGHRRWLLNPASSLFSFGLTNAASSMQVIGLSSSNTANPSWVKWPSSGYFPNTMEPDGRWSLSSGNDNADFTNATVSVTYNGAAVPVTKYAVDNDYAQPTIVWQMPSTMSKVGVYSVKVSNIIVNSTPATASYTVNLFTPY